jgi:hypothetical protein
MASLLVVTLDSKSTAIELLFVTATVIMYFMLPWWTAADAAKLHLSCYVQEKPHHASFETRSNDAAIMDVVVSLRARSRRLNRLSLVTLFLMVGVLAIGFNLFATAELAASGSARLPDLRRQLATRSGELARTKSLQASQKDPEKSAELAGQVEQLTTTIDGIRSDIDRLPESPTNDPLRYALSLLSTKIGAVAILLFGMRILVSLYRYTAKLGSFYESRADLLQVLPEDAAGSGEVLKAVLLPDNVDFDQPRGAGGPTTRIVNAIRDLAISSAKKSAAG